ncbi:MAG: hypothetical protein O7J95_04000 [Planctomycetota bacterium]|nr:hypothetical protein [Planctomycetota bacterium]
MLSRAPVKDLLEQFVRVKSDPRARGRNDSLYRLYKSTQFVPEIAFVSPQGKLLGKLESRDVHGVIAELKAVLYRVRRDSNRPRRPGG